MRYEVKDNKMHLYFTHVSGRIFVITEDIVNGEESIAKSKLIKRMGEMNGLNNSPLPPTS